MIECKECRCSIEGTLKEILVETAAVLAATHELCKKELGEEMADKVFAALGKTAVEYNEIREKLGIV